MEINGVLWDSCPNGIDCEKTYATKDGGVLMRLDRTRILTGEQGAELGIDLPAHEVLAYVPPEQWRGSQP
jgi:hypothetical protein